MCRKLFSSEDEWSDHQIKWTNWGITPLFKQIFGNLWSHKMAEGKLIGLIPEDAHDNNDLVEQEMVQDEIKDDEEDIAMI